MTKTAIVALIGVFVVFYIVTSPDHAADITTGAGHLAGHVAHGVGHFVDKLGS